MEHGKWRIRAGAPDPTCGCGTGVCKGNVLRTLRAASPRTHLVHIGNGRVSDTCGALAADTAFAKDSLAEELEKRGVPFVRFATLRRRDPAPRGDPRALRALARAVTVPPCRRLPETCWSLERVSPGSPRPGA